MLILSDAGAGQILASYFNKTQPVGGNDLVLKLFTSNTTPADTDTAATYTEASGHGYSAITLTAGSWTVSVVAGVKQAAYAKQRFNFSSALGATIYGYFIVDKDNVLIYSERASVAFTPTIAGDYYDVTPIFKLSAGAPA